MVDVTKLSDGKARITKNDTILVGIDYIMVNNSMDTITFYVNNNSLIANFSEITDVHGTKNAKELSDFYINNGYFLSSILSSNDESVLFLRAILSSLNNINETLNKVLFILKGISE